MFAEDQLESLNAEAADIERRLRAFLERVQRANLDRPDNREPGFYSRYVATLNCRCALLSKVRQWLRNNMFIERCYPRTKEDGVGARL